MWWQGLKHSNLDVIGHNLDDSHSRHPLIPKSHKGYAQPFEGDAILLSIKLICQLLFQLTVVLLCIHLQKIYNTLFTKYEHPLDLP